MPIGRWNGRLLTERRTGYLKTGCGFCVSLAHVCRTSTVVYKINDSDAESVDERAI